MGADSIANAADPPTERILAPSSNRFVLFPIRDAVGWDFYKRAEASFWTAEEIDLASDKKDFDSLTEGEKRFIMRVLAFFSSSDGIVNENLAANFMAEVQTPELRQFYAFQIGMEAIHAETYALLIDTLEADPVKKEQLLKGTETFPAIKSKAEWALRWLGSGAPFAERLIAFACVEGIFFSASFCAIFYFKKRNLMHGLCFSNELISRDEGLHRDFAVHVHSLLSLPPSEERVREIVSSAVDAELEFVRDALEVGIIGMNSKMMCQYVRFVADHLLVSMGHSKLYGDSNPFDWMDLISLQGKSNFFERRVSDYQKAGVMDSASGKGAIPRSLSLEEDF